MFPSKFILKATFTRAFISGIQITLTFNIKEPENKLQESIITKRSTHSIS